MRDYSGDIAQIERRIAPLLNIRGGSGIIVQRSPGGICISARPAKEKPGAAAASSSSSGGIVLELYPEWEGDRQYRLNERVVYKGELETYYKIYACLDTSAGAGDVPGVSAQWDVITEDAPEWDAATTYGVDDVVMWGTAWQFHLYTSLAADNTGNLPSDASKWTRGDAVTLGIKQWPPAPGVMVPFKQHIVADVRYDTGTFLFEWLYTAHTFDKTGKLTAVTLGEYSTWAEAEACVPV